MVDDDREKIRQAVNFEQLVGEHVQLTRKGSDLWGCCPFHHEKSASFHINPQTGLWKCFGCGAGGDMFAYVMSAENLNFAGAVQYLADKYGIELSHTPHARDGIRRNRLFACLAAAEQHFMRTLFTCPQEEASAARSYLHNRGLTSDICKAWSIGYAKGDDNLIAELTRSGYSRKELLACDVAHAGAYGLRSRFFNRVMFAIHDEQGKCIGFGGRVINDGKPKYLNTKETPLFHKGKHLYAIDKAKDGIIQTGEVIVCEGYTDVIAMHTHGFTNTVAALGTALTLNHIRLIERFARTRIICMFDGDAAGQKAAERAIQFIDQTSLALMCVVLPNNQDPCEFLTSHPQEELASYLSHAEPLMNFVLRHTLARFDMRVPGQRIEALKSAARILSAVKHSLLIDDFATQLADMLALDVTRVKEQIMKTQPMTHASFSDELTPAPAPAVAPAPAAAAAPAAAPQTAPFQHAAQPASGQAAAQVASASQAAHMQLLSSDAKRQYKAEEELLCLLVRTPGAYARYAQPLAAIPWIDDDHKRIAQLICQHASHMDIPQLIDTICAQLPSAAYILASGRIPSTTTLSQDDAISFLLTSIQIVSSTMRMQEIKSYLKRNSQTLSFDESQTLLKQATALQKNVNNLKKSLSNDV